MHELPALPTAQNFILSFRNNSPSRLYGVLQHPVSGPVELGGDTTLQCSVLTDMSAGEPQCVLVQTGIRRISYRNYLHSWKTEVISVESSSETDSLQRAVSTNSPRGTSASLMLELTTVLCSCVERSSLGMELNWTF
ncbi:hypothetical protein NFI96_032135 [Prochilodus magdalenae]|nr:hypothetical protein NFI96_032135 [Prochilodus magdalenae]